MCVDELFEWECGYDGACRGDRRRRSDGDDMRTGCSSAHGPVVHSRTIEVLDQRGVADRFLAKGQVAQTAMFALTVVHMSASRPVIRMGSGSGRTRSSG